MSEAMAMLATMAEEPLVPAAPDGGGPYGEAALAGLRMFDLAVLLGRVRTAIARRGRAVGAAILEASTLAEPAEAPAEAPAAAAPAKAAPAKAATVLEPLEAVVKNGCVDQGPIHYESHKRGRNWMATVTADKTKPGGLARSFWDKGTTSWRKLPAGLMAGDVVEVAGEYVTGGGRNDKDRIYIRIVAVEAGRLLYAVAEKPD